MYLSAERFFWFNETAPVVEGHTIKSCRVKAAHWRNANQIHNWFVKNVQGQQDNFNEFPVSREQLQDLIDLCIAAKDNPPRPPPAEGYFLGGTELDKWYFQDLTDTIQNLTAALAKFPSDKWEFYYHATL